ncbi:lytic transglycosylase domain-containing protein [Salinisphaera orenii]|uniref:lytic transglycosylase domain-containing protein n=1 Tax=Salinisphaera orenii TaxID=856731 RepID=UPI000DBE5EE2
MQCQSLDNLIQSVGSAHDIPPAIVAGVIEIESADQTTATRAEPYYRWCWDCRNGRPYTATKAQCRQFAAPDDFHAPDAAKAGYYSTDATEWLHQRTSWGLMQIMGAVAREHGLKGPIPGLCDAQTGIEYGCRHLARLRDRFYQSHGWAGVLDAYNDGTPRVERAHDYPDKVAATSDAAAKIIHDGGTAR